MAGKKTKKSKGTTLSLQSFLGDTPVGSIPTAPKVSNWADTVDDDDDFTYSSRSKGPIDLPTAPRAARDQICDEENIPTHGPFVAYISNLPYDIDQEDLIEFFQNMKVVNVRLPKDVNKSKGYGYVDFEDRQSLIDALNMVDTNLKTRRVRIEVSNSSTDERRNRMGRMGDQRRDYGDDPERTAGDWRGGARGIDEGSSSDGYRRGGGFERRDESRGFDRRDDNRDSGFEDNKPGNWRDGLRETVAERPRPSFRESRPGEERGGERDWNRFGDRGFGMRDGSRERDSGRSFGSWRSYAWGGERRDPIEGPSPASSEDPRTRPKLNLQPRSKPIDPTVATEKESATNEPRSAENGEQPRPAPATPVPAANIFGAAKPVDTAAREREIEERLAKSAEARSKEDGDSDKRGPREGAWGRRNGEGRDDQDRSRPVWRSMAVRPEYRDQRDYRDPREPRDVVESRGDSRGPPPNRSGPTPVARGPPKQLDSRPLPDGAEKEKKKDKEDEISKMPKAKDDQAPNFVASNKYSMLPDDVDPDVVEE